MMIELVFFFLLLKGQFYKITFSFHHDVAVRCTASGPPKNPANQGRQFYIDSHSPPVCNTV
jgi:hypothetical protein